MRNHCICLISARVFVGRFKDDPLRIFRKNKAIPLSMASFQRNGVNPVVWVLDPWHGLADCLCMTATASLAEGVAARITKNRVGVIPAGLHRSARR